MLAFLILLLSLSLVSAQSSTIDCINITSPLTLVIPNANTNALGTPIPNGNSNGLAGNARIVFQDNGPNQNISHINITYAFCSSTNTVLADHVVRFRFRSFINQTQFLDASVSACDGVQSFCLPRTPQAGCLEGAIFLNSTWPMMSVQAAPQIWIVGQSDVTYGRFKAGAVHSFADGPPAPNATFVLASQ
jgi:hypothetical protein